MEIGTVKWFGGHDTQRNRDNNFGFISKVSNNEDVYFHRYAIKKDSRLELCQDCAIEGQWVAFECIIDEKHPEKMKAREVQFLEEIPAEKIPEKFSRELLFNKKVKEHLFEVIPWFYLESNIEDYFEHFTSKAVREIFKKRNEEHYFSQSVFQALISYSAKHLCLNWLETYRDVFDFTQATENEVCQLILVNSYSDVARLCIERQEVWEQHPEVVKTFSKSLIEKMEEHGWKCNNALLDYLLKNIESKEAKEYLCRNLSVDDILEHPTSLSFIGDDSLIRLAKEIQWSNSDSSYVDKHKFIIKRIEADVQEQAAVVIAKGLLRSSESLFIWWKCLNDSVKVRVLIYFSNFSSRKQEWFDAIGKIYRFECDANNELILAILQYFKVIYYKKPDYQGKQQCFMDAHTKLMEYITGCYNRGADITPALNTLLVKCYAHKPKDPYYFCDAKKWENAGGVFCPEGISRTYSRRKCEYFDSTDLSQTKFVEEHSYESQNLADFVKNLNFKPDLSSINTNITEYAYRISAYVNRLIDMRPHMKCKCGAWFYADFRYSKLVTAKLSATVFDCPKYDVNNPDSHDARVYLNYCCRCHEVIDSRECKIQDAMHYYLCMKCGGTEMVEPGTQCPNCGTTTKTFLEYSGNRISCKKCGHQAWFAF